MKVKEISIKNTYTHLEVVELQTSSMLLQSKLDKQESP